MKKQFALALAVVFCLSAAACGNVATASQSSPAASSGSYTIPEPDFAGDPVILKQFEAPTGPTATIKTTMGDIEVMFFPEAAPKAVENFLTHAKDGYYDGLLFHRVINDFMIQGGDPLGTGAGGESIWGSAFEDEFSDSLRNFRGALSMANSGKSTNGSQFFIVQTTKASGMDGSYADTCYSQFLERSAYQRISTQTPGMSEQEQQAYLAAEQQKLNEQLQQPTPQAYLDRMAPVIAKYNELGGTAYLDGKHTVFGQVTSGMEVVDAIAAVATQSDRPVEDVKIVSIAVKE